MSHTNKLHILYLIVIFYSWFLTSFSKCLYLKKNVVFPEQHSTSTSLTFQLHVTSAYTDKKAKIIWAAPETELQHPGPENFPGVDACSPRKRTSFNTLVRGRSTEEDTLSSLAHPLQQQTAKSFPSAKEIQE